jgi:hypothetical protein
MRYNITAVLQMREHLQNQVTIKKWSLNRMDSIHPHTRIAKCSQCNQRKMHHMDPPGILHSACIECEQKVELCCNCSVKPRLAYASRCRDCWNEQNRANKKKRPRKLRNPKPKTISTQDRMLRYNYNITKDEYDLMLLHQGGVCAICGNGETSVYPKTGKVRSLSVDHSHETGEVRELLCQRCNLVLGRIEQDYSLVKKCLKYLKRHDT